MESSTMHTRGRGRFPWIGMAEEMVLLLAILAVGLSRRHRY
jgi:hypothetical protein